MVNKTTLQRKKTTNHRLEKIHDIYETVENINTNWIFGDVIGNILDVIMILWQY